jgi:hypothetical protein
MKYLADIIRGNLPIEKVSKVCLINRTGTHFIGSEPLFCTGDGIILSPNVDKTVEVKIESVADKLVVDPNLSERQAAVGMMKIVNLTPEAGRIIFAHCLLNVMRAVYSEADKPPSCIIYLVGKTGIKKTTFAAFQTQLYDRDKGIVEPIRLNASISAAEAILNSNYDCVVVLDDLFPAKSSEIKRNQEQTLIELVRIIGDNVGRARISGKKVITKDPQCGAIVTGEYLIGTGSDAARLLPVTFTTPIDNTRLSECQAELLVLSTFYGFFLKWYIENYHGIREWLTKQLLESRRTHLGVHDRLQETYFHLGSAYKIFLLYCLDRGFVSEVNAKEQYRSFQALLVYLVKKQDVRVNMGVNNETKNVDYLSLIKTLCNGNVFLLADDVKRLRERHHGFIGKNHLYLRGHKLMEEILKYVPTANYKAVSDYLLSQDALTVGNDKRVVQIKSPLGNTRFYAIRLKKLK